MKLGALRIIIILSFVSLAMVCCHNDSFVNTPICGIYEGDGLARIGVNKNIVCGIYHYGNADMGVYCRLFFVGKITPKSKNKIQIKIYSSVNDPSFGILTFKDSTLTIQSKDMLLYCQRAVPLLQGLSFNLQKNIQYFGFAMVNEDGSKTFKDFSLKEPTIILKKGTLLQLFNQTKGDYIRVSRLKTPEDFFWISKKNLWL